MINNNTSPAKKVLQEYYSIPFNIFINDLVLFTQYTILDNHDGDNNISISESEKENLKKLQLLDFKNTN